MVVLLWSDTLCFSKETFNFRIILDLQKSCEDSTAFLNKLHLVSSHGSILYNCYTILKTTRITRLHYYQLNANFIFILPVSPQMSFLFQDLIQGTTCV